jgi:hypothetical protein
MPQIIHSSSFQNPTWKNVCLGRTSAPTFHQNFTLSADFARTIWKMALYLPFTTVLTSLDGIHILDGEMRSAVRKYLSYEE